MVNAFLLKETLEGIILKTTVYIFNPARNKMSLYKQWAKKTPPRNTTPVYTIYYTTLIQHSRPMQCTPVNISTVILSPYKTLQYKSMRVPNCLLVLFKRKVNTPLNLMMQQVTFIWKIQNVLGF